MVISEPPWHVDGTSIYSKTGQLVCSVHGWDAEEEASNLQAIVALPELLSLLGRIVRDESVRKMNREPAKLLLDIRELYGRLYG